MSTASISQSAVKKFTHFSPLPSSAEVTPTSLTDLLIKVSAVEPTDHVTVVGGNLADHLVGLACWGCVSAIGVLPGSRLSALETADVVWFTEISDADISRAALVHGIGCPKAVVLVTRAVDDLGWVQDDLRLLAPKGLVQCAYHQLADRLVIVASRPKWLRRVV